MALFKKFVKGLKKILKDARLPEDKKPKRSGKKSKTSSGKKTAKKTPGRKKVARKAAKKKNAKKATKKSKKALPKKPSLPPNYVKIGVITHYFPHVEAGVIKVERGTITVGDQIHIKGTTTDFKQYVESLQIDHKPVPSAKIGAEAGIQTKNKVRQHDVVYLIKPK